MPRSFLVKKHQSSKKGSYGGVNSRAQETSRDPQQQSYILTQHYRPASSPCLQQRSQFLSSSPHEAERLQPSSLKEASPLSLTGCSSEANRRSAAEACKQVEPRSKGGLEIQRVIGDYRGRESILPPSLPLLALLPVVPPSSSQENFECLDCHEGHLSFSGLDRHNQLHCDWSSKKSFSCKYCEKEYVSLGALKMHIRTHTLPCVCKLCGKAFSRPWLLQGHIRTHTGEKPFSCFRCSRAFADRSNLRAHLQTHSEVKKYQCSSCCKTFSRISLLAKHQEAGCPLC